VSASTDSRSSTPNPPAAGPGVAMASELATPIPRSKGHHPLILCLPNQCRVGGYHDLNALEGDAKEVVHLSLLSGPTSRLWVSPKNLLERGLECRVAFTTRSHRSLSWSIEIPSKTLEPTASSLNDLTGHSLLSAIDSIQELRIGIDRSLLLVQLLECDASVKEGMSHVLEEFCPASRNLA
jgi:hypothetical protein